MHFAAECYAKGLFFIFAFYPVVEFRDIISQFLLLFKQEELIKLIKYVEQTSGNASHLLIVYTFLLTISVYLIGSDMFAWYRQASGVS